MKDGKYKLINPVAHVVIEVKGGRVDCVESMGDTGWKVGDKEWSGDIREDLWEFLGDTKFTQAQAQEMHEMLERVKTVLLRTYDVTDYPADGNTDCDIYAAKIDELLAKARGE